MFFIGAVLKKYKERKERILIIQDIINALEIDTVQKNLYLESLNELDEEGLQSLYLQLTALISIFEDNKAIQQYKNSSQKRETEEDFEKQKELNSLHLLLDNV